MLKKIMIVAILAGTFQYWNSNGGQWTKPMNPEHDEVIMYSLSTCGNCVVTARALREEGIEFTELYIDKDQQAEDELHEKMRNAGIDVSFYYTPVLDINGTILANNPKFNLILSEVDKYDEMVDEK